MRHVQEILTIPDANGDFPVKITADHGYVLIESRGSFLDEHRMDVLRAALKAAGLTAARQRAEIAEEAEIDS